MPLCMKKKLKIIRCKECKKEVLELREHWEDKHEKKLKAIDNWLGRCNDKLSEANRIVRRQEKGEEA